MYLFIFVFTYLFFSHAAVIRNESEAKIIKYENTNDGTGNYKFSFETSNGIIREESGYLINIGQEDEHMVVKGSYSYTDLDGNTVTVNYTADENGYHILSKPSQPSPQISFRITPPSVVATLLGK